MDCQVLLEKQAADQGLSLTPLGQMARYSHSLKIPCCGGVVVRVETESSADSTVCLRDDSGTCFCALHGDLTSRYPDVLSAGALLCFANITLLVTSAKMPPLLVACLENLVSLMLPEDDAAEEAASTRTSASTALLSTRHGPAGGVGGGPGEGGTADTMGEKETTTAAVGESLDAFFHPCFPLSTPTHPPPPSSSSSTSAPRAENNARMSAPPPHAAGLQHPVQTSSVPAQPPQAAPVKAEIISDDDADCLELVDEL